MAAYREKEDLISIGAYQPGSDPLTDAAIAARPAIERLPAPVGRRALDAEEADSGLAALVGHDAPPPQAAVPELQAAVPAAPTGGSGSGVPLHSAIPPLNLSA